MAIILRRNVGTALSYDQLDDNFVDYTTFRDKFDQTQWVGGNDGKVLFYENTTGKIRLKELTGADIATAFTGKFNEHLATKTTNDLTEGSSNLYYTSTRANADFDTRLGTKDTTNLSEGTNKYYTDARVDARIALVSARTLNDIPATTSADDSKVIIYDKETDKFKYASLITEKLVPVTNYGLISDSDTITGGAGVTTTSLQSLTNVNFTSISNASDQNVLFYNATAGDWRAGVITTTGDVRDNGVVTFSALQDSPTNYTGSAGKYVRVKSSVDGLEFNTISSTEIEEGTKKFYTDGRFDTRLATKTTDNLTEGSSNLYFTNTRADGRIALQVGANLNLASKNTDALSEGSTNLYYTQARVDARFNTNFAAKKIENLSNVQTPGPADDGYVLYYQNSSGTFKLGNFNTSDNLPEGSTNLYYTDARVDNRVANRLEGNTRMRLPSYTTTARNALSGVANGEMIYNTTLNKIQGYENGAWKNLSTVYQ